VITDGNKICDIVTNSIFYIFQKVFFSASEEVVVNVYLIFQVFCFCETDLFGNFG
jgi:hypothetical protein